jgi:pyruvate,water dikinase
MIISLKKISADDFADVGSKAFNLGRLSRLGFLIPQGFCIKAGAFQEHLKINNLSAGIESALSKLDSAAADVKKTILSEIRQNIINAPLTENLKTQIEHYYGLLSAKYIAVRSSATAEDLPQHSFAGQYDTYLNVSGIAECVEAVKKCWASLWTDRAYEYRKNNGIDHLSVNMAVIIQELIEADMSGVLFTADPVNGYKSRILIEAVPGLGDKLVSGEAVPRRFVIDKNTLGIVQQNGGQAVNIDEVIIKKLAKLARKAEKKFGCPQDIEWAIKNNEIYFLQTRPITTIQPLKSWDQRQIWTNANTGEVIPDVVTPITWSMVELFAKKFYDSFFGWFGFDLEDNPIGDLVAGRAYFNINTFTGVAKHIPKRFQLNVNDILGGEHKDMFEKGLLDIPQENIPDIKFSFIKFITNMPVFIFSFLFYGDKNIKSYISRLSAGSDYLESLQFDTIGENELAATFNSAMEQAFEFEPKGSVSIIRGFHCYIMLNNVCKKWLKDGTLTGRLLVGAGDMEDAQAGIELWKLAQEAHKLQEVEKIILSGGCWRDIENKIAENIGGKEFLKSWDTFMVRHGHHTRGEGELFNPRWSEEPDYILKLIVGYIKDIEGCNLIESQNRQKLESQRLFEQSCRQLKNSLKRFLFKYLLGGTKQGVAFRENWKNQMIRRMALVRKMLLWFGRELEKRGVIEKTDDIFFLEYQEIGAVFQGKANFNVKKVIARRKAEYEKNKSIVPPKVVMGKFDPDNFVPDKEDINANTKILSGLAVSPGIVTGMARVILRADTNESVKAGEILVAPFTDPGWTPYFITAAGIVMDLGGLLSHGSIIAREYGIPAVVNVGSATKIIQTGQMLEVDGNKGIVRLL